MESSPHRVGQRLHSLGPSMAATGAFLANAVEAPVCLSTRHCTPLTVGRYIRLLNHYSNVAVSFLPFRILVYVRIRIHCSFLCLLFDTV